MNWLKEIFPLLIKKLKSWEVFALCLIAIAGYFGVQFYKAQTERMIATSMRPKAEKTNWVRTEPLTAGIGIIKEDNSQIEIAR